MRTVRRSVRALAATVVAAAVAAAACGEGVSPEERLAAAASATTGEGTAAFTMEMRVQVNQEGSGMDMTMSGDGVADLAENRGRMEMSSPGMGNSMTTVFDGDAVYVRLPSFMTGGRTQWVRQRAGSGTGVGSAGGGLGQNPLGMLDALDAVEGEVRSLGSDTVRGIDVEGFGVTIDGSKLWGDARDVPPELMELEIPTEVWLDDGNRVRRMVVEVDLGPVVKAVRERATDSLSEKEAGALGEMLAGMVGTMTMTTELHDFGTEVDVQVPDESVVVDQERFRQGMGGMRGGMGGARGGEGGGAADTADAGQGGG
jgi:hypothetical protein